MKHALTEVVRIQEAACLVGKHENIRRRVAYVAISRASDDARIYTNDAETLGETLETDISMTAAIAFSIETLNQAGKESASTPRGNNVAISTKVPQIDLEGFGLGL